MLWVELLYMLRSSEDWCVEDRLGKVVQVWSGRVEELLYDISVVVVELLADIVHRWVYNTICISASLNSLGVAYSIFVVWGQSDGPLQQMTGENMSSQLSSHGSRLPCLDTFHMCLSDC